VPVPRGEEEELWRQNICEDDGAALRGAFWDLNKEFSKRY
jgi:hypothetical protein